LTDLKRRGEWAENAGAGTPRPRFAVGHSRQEGTSSLRQVPCFAHAVLGALLIAAVADAGTIRGTLRIASAGPAAAPKLNAYPGSAGAIAGAHGQRRGEVTDAVVYVAKVPAGAESALAARRQPRPTLAQKNEAFVPRVVPVAAGTAVDFPNLDPIYHNVFSLSPPRRFDLGKYPRGQSRSVVFPRPGLVHVFCDIHSNMAAFVLVLPHHAFTQPAADGAWTLEGLPPGRYELRAWHPDVPEMVRTVDLPESGEARLDLTF
jgi:plastocyanin